MPGTNTGRDEEESASDAETIVVIPEKRAKRDDHDVTNWRDQASGLASLINIMFEKKISTDLVIKVGRGMRELECHSFVVASQSPVFELMLSVEESSRKTILLMEDHPDLFSAFLKCMYQEWREDDFSHMDNIPAYMTPAIAVGIMGLACKYSADHIARRMEHFIYAFLCEKSAEKTIDLFLLLKRNRFSLKGFNSAKIVRRIRNCISGGAENIFSSTALNKLSQEDLGVILESTTMQQLQCAESYVYNGCIMWATEQCRIKGLEPVGKNLRSELGPVLYLIRFPLLTDKFMTDKVIFSDILHPKEMKELVAYRLNKDCEHLKNQTPKFPLEPRCRMSVYTFERLNCCNISADLQDFSSPHGFEVTASEDMLLSSLWLFGGDPAINHSCTMEIGYKVAERFEFRPVALQVKRISPDSKMLWVNFVNGITFPKNSVACLKFTISGGNTNFSGEEVADTTKEIIVWGKRSIVLTFSKSESIPSGLKQIPLLTFGTQQ